MVSLGFERKPTIIGPHSQQFLYKLALLTVWSGLGKLAIKRTSALQSRVSTERGEGICALQAPGREKCRSTGLHCDTQEEIVFNGIFLSPPSPVRSRHPPSLDKGASFPTHEGKCKGPGKSPENSESYYSTNKETPKNKALM